MNSLKVQADFHSFRVNDTSAHVIFVNSFIGQFCYEDWFGASLRYFIKAASNSKWCDQERLHECGAKDSVYICSKLENNSPQHDVHMLWTRSSKQIDHF